MLGNLTELARRRQRVPPAAPGSRPLLLGALPPGPLRRHSPAWRAADGCRPVYSRSCDARAANGSPVPRAGPRRSPGRPPAHRVARAPAQRRKGCGVSNNTARAPVPRHAKGEAAPFECHRDRARWFRRLEHGTKQTKTLPLAFAPSRTGMPLGEHATNLPSQLATSFARGQAQPQRWRTLKRCLPRGVIRVAVSHILPGRSITRHPPAQGRATREAPTQARALRRLASQYEARAGRCGEPWSV